MKNVRIGKKARISQGDIYADLMLVKIFNVYIDEISKIDFPFVVVLTQDCDLK